MAGGRIMRRIIACVATSADGYIARRGCSLAPWRRVFPSQALEGAVADWSLSCERW